MKEFDMLIIGGGPSTRNAVKIMRQLKPDVTSAVIRYDRTMINHCAMPYALEGGEVTLDKIIVSDQRLFNWKAELFIDKATSIDPKEKIVTTENDKFKYQKLFLLTGSMPIKPPIPGIDLENVFSLRHTEDVEAIDKALSKAKKVVVIGGGYIGVEFGSLVRKRGLDVTIVEMLPHCMMATLDPDFCELAEDEMRKNGVTVLTNTQVTAIKGDEKVSSVEIGDKEIEADLVILGVGVRAETSLAEQTGITVGKTGIIVDNRMRTNIPDIYAAGDNIETHCYVTGKVKPGKIGSNAVVEAKVAVMNALGHDRIFPGIIGPSATKIFNLCFGMVGVGQGQAERDGLEVFTGDSETTSMYEMLPGTMKTRVRLYFKKQDHTVVGGQIVGSQFLAGHIDMIAQAIRNHLTLEELSTIHYTTHPELTPNPATQGIVLAAENAWLKTRKGF